MYSSIGKNSLHILLFLMTPLFLYSLGVIQKYCLKDLEKVDEEEKPDSRAIWVAEFLEYFRSRAAFSNRRRFERNFTVSPVIALKILWKWKEEKQAALESSSSDGDSSK